jgi:hypothetical protein
MRHDSSKILEECLELTDPRFRALGRAACGATKVVAAGEDGPGAC